MSNMREDSDIDYKRFRLTDLGNAQNLVSRHGSVLHYCFPWQTWLHWDGKRWQNDDTGTVTRFAKETVRSRYADAANAPSRDDRKDISKWAHTSESEAKIRAMITLAQSEVGVPVLHSDLDRDPWMLNVLNGS